jgi:hypothetical protein
MSVENNINTLTDPIRQRLAWRSAIHQTKRYFLNYSGNRFKVAEFFNIFCNVRSCDLNKHYVGLTIKAYQTVCIECGLIVLDQSSGVNRYFLTQLGYECLTLFNEAYRKKLDQIKFKKFLHPVID